MADEEDLELDEGAKKKGGSKLKLILIISLVGLLVLGAAVGATLFFTGAFSGGDEQAETAKNEKKAPKQAQYLSLDPPFVVNFESQNQVRFLQIAVEVMSREATVLESVKLHMPAIRNNLVLLFSSQDAAAVGTREGKEQLRVATLQEINKILRKETGEAGLEAVYFTSFVMQ